MIHHINNKLFLLLISGDDAFENKTVEFSVLAYKIEKNVHCNYHILQFEENIVLCILNILQSANNCKKIFIYLYYFTELRHKFRKKEKYLCFCSISRAHGNGAVYREYFSVVQKSQKRLFCLYTFKPFY